MNRTHIEVIDTDGRKHILPIAMVEVWEASPDDDCACIVDAGSIRIYADMPYEYFRRILLLGEEP